MKKKWISLMTMSILILTGCGEDSSSIPDSVDDRDSQIVAVYDAYKANGGTLDYDTWLSTIKGDKGDVGEQGPKGDKGETGKGITSVIQSGVEGNKVTYTIIYTDGSTSTFTMTNGTDGHTPAITINADGYWCIDGTSLGIKAKGDTGSDGRGINSMISSYDENGNTLVTIIYTDGTNQIITIKKGEKGDKGDKGMDGSSLITGTGVPSADVGHDGDSYVDTDTWDYYIKNNGSWFLNGNIKGSKGDTGSKGDKGDKGDAGQDGRSVVSITKTATDGNVDTYTITYSDGRTSTFEVTNGQNGEQGIQGNPGEDGHTPTISIGENGNWYIDGVDSGTKAQGLKGDKGDKGEDAITYVPVIFNNWDGTKLYEFYFEKGTDAVYEGETPTHPDTTEDGKTFKWTFKGWDKDLTNIQKPTIFTAVFQGPVSCKFVNYDGTELYSTKIAIGENVSYEGSIPTKPSEVSGDQTIDWTFSGWDKSLYGVMEDIVFIAQFNAPNAIKCTFQDEDGTVLGIQYVGLNAKVIYEGETPKKDEVNHGDGTITKYEFEGWDKSIRNLTEDTIFTAKYSENTYYECKFYDYDGSLLYTTSTFYGGSVDYKERTPIRAQEADGTTITEYTFEDWDTSLINITEPTEFKPVFSSKEFTGYKVTFVDTINPEFSYSHYYQENTYARNPYANYWSYDDKDVTLFVGWDKDISSVTQEITTNAVYKTISRGQNGEYPQDKVTNETLIAALDEITETDSQGYIEYQGERYAKKEWQGYFKVSPIKWRYLSQHDGQSMFLSEYILDSHVWNATAHEDGIYQNNYKYSDIRKWLNDDFIDKAFNDDSLIATTKVDNSAESTGVSYNKYVCEATNDKLFLLSTAEACNYENGFSRDRYDKDLNRVGYYTEYANNGRGDEVGYWCLRSPSEHNGDYVYHVDNDGHLNYSTDVRYSDAIRPALR